MATIQLPDDVLADAARGAERDGVDLRTWIARAIEVRAPVRPGKEIPYDDCGFLSANHFPPVDTAA